MPPWFVHRHNEGDCPTPSFYRQPPIPGGPHLTTSTGGRSPLPPTQPPGEPASPNPPCAVPPSPPDVGACWGPCRLVARLALVQATHAPPRPIGYPPHVQILPYSPSSPPGPFVFRCRYFTPAGPWCQGARWKIVVIICNTRPIQSPTINPGPSPTPIHHPTTHGPPTPHPGPP